MLTSLDSPTDGLTAGQIVVLRQQIAWALHVIMIALLIFISPYIQFCSSSSSQYGLLMTPLINTLCLLLLCSDIVDYSYDDLLSSILPTYHTLINSGLEILVFSGDVDAIVPVTGTREWLSQLPLKIKSEWRPWYVNSQVGGYVTVYDKLTFSTVRGAGHMVPYTEPARALHLFESFINKTPL
jgi:hypothetical protein